MQIGIAGLGRMGANISRRLMKGGHETVVFDINSAAVGTLTGEGASGASSLKELVSKLRAPRSVWLMLPAGEITENAVIELSSVLEPGDTLIDGGNTYYKDDIRRANFLREKGIDYLDAGTSGGIWGLQRGYCLMVGGPREAFDRNEAIFRTLAPGPDPEHATPGRTPGTADSGYLYCGPGGSGHFVKMVHNGIEYGLMQAYAEGFDIMGQASSLIAAEGEHFKLPLEEIAEVWRHGSVVSSWLLDLCAAALAGDPQLSHYTGSVADSGEGRWTVEAALEEGVACNVLTASLYARFRSRQDHTFGEKLLSAMRAGFGGHVEKKA